jgi:hypothetical protein
MREQHMTSRQAPAAKLQATLNRSWAVRLRPSAAIVVAVLLFGVTVRPFGLAVALPLAIFAAGLASVPVRWLELAAVTAVLSIVIATIAKGLLRLPFPLWPSFGG